MGAGEQEEELPPEAVAALKEYHELMWVSLMLGFNIHDQVPTY
jgi:hypothetical protein